MLLNNMFYSIFSVLLDTDLFIHYQASILSQEHLANTNTCSIDIHSIVLILLFHKGSPQYVPHVVYLCLTEAIIIVTTLEGTYKNVSSLHIYMMWKWKELAWLAKLRD